MIRKRMASLPWEIVMDILNGLPGKDLLRYRCVSKSWRSLIDDPDFIKSHLKRSKETLSNTSLVLVDCYDHNVIGVDLDVLDSLENLDSPVDGRVKAVVGSSNGLLALESGKHIILWNPTTRRYRKLTLPRLVQPAVYGFGHDPVNDDYKMVRVMSFGLPFGGIGQQISRNKVEVYSVKSNTWKPVNDFPYHFHSWSESGVLVSNALHWVVYRELCIMLPSMTTCYGSSLIIAFDLVTGEYREVPLPFNKNNGVRMTVGVLGGSLCAIFNYLVRDIKTNEGYSSDHVDMWVMKEYGVKESWTKLCTVGQRHVIGPLNYVLPIAYLKIGNRVLMNHNGERFMWYDLETEMAENVIIFGSPYKSMKIVLCETSLIGLDRRSGWKRVDEEEEADNGRSQLGLYRRRVSTMESGKWIL
ncbi:hypothetical protein TIFTF001_006060 [Ficus carica]|uniref:F-box domain-containing protein n=1 Tax=Ficus carica TaxID=3494 RepID=A0AA87ZM20_FICCA|nr:hypothetical protein TIFTF001_006060 [Ficus carica]